MHEYEEIGEAVRRGENLTYGTGRCLRNRLQERTPRDSSRTPRARAVLGPHRLGLKKGVYMDVWNNEKERVRQKQREGEREQVRMGERPFVCQTFLIPPDVRRPRGPGPMVARGRQTACPQRSPRPHPVPRVLYWRTAGKMLHDPDLEDRGHGRI